MNSYHENLLSRLEKTGVKLDPVVKEKWLTALRSGKFKKGRTVLRDDANNKHCCLGVLAEVCGRPISDGGTATLHPETGLNEEYGWFYEIIGPDNTEALYLINDDGEHKNKDFSDVIPLIEKYL